MDKATLYRLQGINKYPCVTLILPTHRTSPDNKQDLITLKNLAKQVEERLGKEFSARETEGLLKKLHEMIDSIDVNHNLDGQAIFVNDEFAEKVDLPFHVRERVIIDHTFATRDLIKAMNRTYNYYVMSLSAKEINLYQATRDKLTKVESHGFPHKIEMEVADSSHLKKNVSQVRENKIKEFFNITDKAFYHVYNEHAYPLVLVGVKENIANYKEIADHKKLILHAHEGNMENKSAHEIGKVVWPEVRELMAKERNSVIDELGVAEGAQKTAYGIQQIWTLAKEGRGATLIVEENYAPAGILEESTQQLTLVDDSTQPGVIDDLVDEVAEFVVQTGGKVVFVDPGLMKEKIALILRY